MRAEIEATLKERAKIVHNLDKIIGYANKKHKGSASQMSLFAEDDSYTTIVLDEPKSFNPFDFAQREYDVLGASLLYSEYERYEGVRCRYCNSSLDEIFGEEFEGNKTFLAKLMGVERRTSSFGNAYAKLTFAHEGIESRMYLFGELYGKRILNCFTNRIYLVTANYNKERNSMNLVDFMRADEISDLKVKAVWASTSLRNLPLLKTYLYCHMKGEDHPVNIKIEDNGLVFMEALRCNIDNENLTELRKQGITIKLR